MNKNENEAVLNIEEREFDVLIIWFYHQVTSYAHGSSDLLGIQIDAAINPGMTYYFCFLEAAQQIKNAFILFTYMFRTL